MKTNCKQGAAVGNETDTRCEQNLNEASGPRKIQKAFHQFVEHALWNRPWAFEGPAMNSSKYNNFAERNSGILKNKSRNKHDEKKNINVTE